MKNTPIYNGETKLFEVKVFAYELEGENYYWVYSFYTKEEANEFCKEQSIK